MKKENVFNFISSFVLSTLLLFGGQAQAQTLPDTGGRLYGARISVDNDGLSGTTNMRTRSFNFDTAEDAHDFLFDHSSGIDLEDREFAAEGAFSGYNDDGVFATRSLSALEIAINIQGALVVATYGQGNTVISFQTPGLGLNIVCGSDRCVYPDNIPGITTSGGVTLDRNSTIASAAGITGTRDRSEDVLTDYLEDTDFLSKLQEHLAAASSTSIVAGNPSSLQSTLAASAFDNATGLDGGDNSSNGAITANNVIPVGLQYGSYRQAGMDVDNYTLPIRYAYEWSDGSKISVGLPLSYVTIENAKVYKVGLEVAYTHPMNKQWKLTPGVGYGMIGSKDLLTGAQVASVSLTSLYTFDQSMVGGEDWSLSVANMVGYYQTFNLPFKVSGNKIGAKLSNQIIKNGLILDAKKKIFSYPVNIKAYFTDTRFFGDSLYSERYDEIGVFISPNKKKSFGQNQGLNMSYLFAEGDISGFNLSYSYRF